MAFTNYIIYCSYNDWTQIFKFSKVLNYSKKSWLGKLFNFFFFNNNIWFVSYRVIIEKTPNFEKFLFLNKELVRFLKISLTVHRKIARSHCILTTSGCLNKKRAFECKFMLNIRSVHNISLHVQSPNHNQPQHQNIVDITLIRYLPSHIKTVSKMFFFSKMGKICYQFPTIATVKIWNSSGHTRSTSYVWCDSSCLTSYPCNNSNYAS